MKNNKTTEPKAPKQSKNIKASILGLMSLVVALAEIVGTYVFVTQDNQILLPIAVVLGLDASQRLARAFTKVV